MLIGIDGQLGSVDPQPLFRCRSDDEPAFVTVHLAQVEVRAYTHCLIRLHRAEVHEFLSHVPRRAEAEMVQRVLVDAARERPRCHLPAHCKVGRQELFWRTGPCPSGTWTKRRGHNIVDVWTLERPLLYRDWLGGGRVGEVTPLVIHR